MPNDKEELKPCVSFETVCEWFEKAKNECVKQGRKESALLWLDGLKYLKYYNTL